MCEDCGCGITDKDIQHDHKHDHLHSHEHKSSGVHHHENKISLSILTNIHEKNNQKAEEIRQLLSNKKILCVNLMSAPGSGKTSLLEETAKILGKKMAVIEGDLETNKDAERIKKKGVQAYQITTGQTCHLDAAMVAHGISHINTENLEYLFVENVGNLVCPASYDVGAHINIVLLSVPEGDDKAAKYPVMFRKSDRVFITKVDLLPHFDFNIVNVKKDIENINPKADVKEFSVKDDKNIKEFIEYLLSVKDKLYL
ncbi:MAG: hydrogenase nickel incorporation protein HypB [Spirochaetia bacterium]|nr:hydrogenase nickel incorporation protein HypB [Spirochaetia bacterium]